MRELRGASGREEERVEDEKKGHLAQPERGAKRPMVAQSEVFAAKPDERPRRATAALSCSAA
jgi:hypothetical protein